MKGKILIIGSGIAGMTAALDLANVGYEVFLVEKEKEIGGKAYHLACKATESCQKCSTCIVPQTKNKIEQHHNIRILPFSVLTDLQGEPGSFRASIRLLNDIRSDLGAETTIEVKGVIVATGFEPYNAKNKSEYGYGVHKNVISAYDLELAFQFSSSLKEIYGENINRIGFIQCVGSREISGNNYCSRICCMNSIRLVNRLNYDYPNAEINVFYTDLQVIGKDAHEFFLKVKGNNQIKFIRGMPSKVFRYPREYLTVRYSDTISGEIKENFYDLIILNTSILPQKENQLDIPRINLEKNNFGFYQQREEGVSSQEGIFLAGSCQGPKNIPESIAHAKAAVGQVLQYFNNEDNN